MDNGIIYLALIFFHYGGDINVLMHDFVVYSTGFVTVTCSFT